MLQPVLHYVPNEFSVKCSNLTNLARPPQNQIISENDLPIYYYEIKKMCAFFHILVS